MMEKYWQQLPIKVKKGWVYDPDHPCGRREIAEEGRKRRVLSGFLFSGTPLRFRQNINRVKNQWEIERADLLNFLLKVDTKGSLFAAEMR